MKRALDGKVAQCSGQTVCVPAHGIAPRNGRVLFAKSMVSMLTLKARVKGNRPVEQNTISFDYMGHAGTDAFNYACTSCPRTKGRPHPMES